jgi:hypothetical protein
MVIFAAGAIALLILSPFSLLISAYGAARILMILFLGAPSSPKMSPLAFAVGVAGTAVALGKLSVDIAKAINS